VSEGLDFVDQARQSIVMIEIPFAMKMDPKVLLFVDFVTSSLSLKIGSYSISSIRTDLFVRN